MISQAALLVMNPYFRATLEMTSKSGESQTVIKIPSFIKSAIIVDFCCPSSSARSQTVVCSRTIISPKMTDERSGCGCGGCFDLSFEKSVKSLHPSGSKYPRFIKSSGSIFSKGIQSGLTCKQATELLVISDHG